MKVLFLHPNQPSQFKQPAIELAKDPANEVVFLSRLNLDVVTPGVRLVAFKEKPPHDGKVHPFMRKLDEGCRRATAVASVCAKLKQQGFTPDVIVAHSGWGDGMYLRTIYPDTPQLNYMEFFFPPVGCGPGFRSDHQKTAQSAGDAHHGQCHTSIEPSAGGLVYHAHLLAEECASDGDALENERAA